MSRRRRAAAGRDGYASLAAVAAIAAFAYVAFEVMAANRGAIISLSAQVDRARMSAAADAGVALAAHGVGVTDARRWPIDGRAQTLAFEGMSLVIAVEDERGKAPVNRLSEAQSRRMFAAAGATGARLEQLTAAFLDWRDPDDIRRPAGAEAADYATDGIAPRNGEIRTLSELSRLKGMDRQTYERLQRLGTVFFGLSGGFDRSTARPEVIAIMDGVGGPATGAVPPDEQAGQSDDRRGRAMTVRVLVTDPRGGRLERTSIIELTGDRLEPYWVRYAE